MIIKWIKEINSKYFYYLIQAHMHTTMNLADGYDVYDV